MPNRRQESDQAEASARQGLGEIREILFGDDLRDHEEHFARLERQISEMTGELKAELARRFDALEARLGEEVNLLNGGLAQLKGQGNAGREELRRQFAEEVRNIRAQIDSRFQKLLDIERQDATRLAEQKTGRADLAEMLSEVARRLREGTEPAPEET